MSMYRLEMRNSKSILCMHVDYIANIATMLSISENCMAVYGPDQLAKIRTDRPDQILLFVTD